MVSNEDQSFSTNSYKYLSYWNPTDPPAPSTQVVTCFLQKENKILALQRARKDAQHTLWGIPGGKLDKKETPLAGLVRELEEETGVSFKETNFSLLATAKSITPSDGQYGLYLYYGLMSENKEIKINHSEHYAFRWVTLSEFESLKLLTAQGEAFKLVRAKLEALINKK